MLHELYVDTLKDRVMAWTTMILFAVVYVLICVVLSVWSELFTGITSLLILLTTELLVYLLHRDLVQEQPGDESDEYTAMLANIEDVGNKLSDLALFLRREQEKVEASEATVKRLRSEQTELEPVVTMQRETAEAFLAFHTKITASRAWKQHALTFMMGIITSAIVSALFEYLKLKGIL